MSKKSNKITIRAPGGEKMPLYLNAALSSIGANANKCDADFRKVTAPYQGLKVLVEVTKDEETNKFTVEAKPTTATLLKMEILKDRPSDVSWKNRTKIVNRHSGNISFDKILEIATSQYLARVIRTSTYTNAVLQVLGTCQSIGISIDGKSPRDLTREIKEGKVVIPDVVLPLEEDEEEVEEEEEE